MHQSLPLGLDGILVIGLCVCLGYSNSQVLSLADIDPTLDQQFIVDQYLRKAALMKQKAEDLRIRAERYAQLFGPDSEWATSAKLLEKFYEKEAKDRERLAILHSDLLKSSPHSPIIDPP